MGITWHDGKQTPNVESGSYIILTNKGDIAEAEWRNNHWYPYRWSSKYEPNEVRAWCHLDDVKDTYYISGMSAWHNGIEFSVQFDKDGWDSSEFCDVLSVRIGKPFKRRSLTFSNMRFKAICNQDKLLEWLNDCKIEETCPDCYYNMWKHAGTACLEAYDTEAAETIRTFNLQDVYPVNGERIDDEHMSIEFCGRFQNDMVD